MTDSLQNRWSATEPVAMARRKRQVPRPYLPHLDVAFRPSLSEGARKRVNADDDAGSYYEKPLSPLRLAAANAPRPRQAPRLLQSTDGNPSVQSRRPSTVRTTIIFPRSADRVPPVDVPFYSCVAPSCSFCSCASLSFAASSSSILNSSAWSRSISSRLMRPVTIVFESGKTCGL